MKNENKTDKNEIRVRCVVCCYSLLANLCLTTCFATILTKCLFLKVEVLGTHLRVGAYSRGYLFEGGGYSRGCLIKDLQYMNLERTLAGWFFFLKETKLLYQLGNDKRKEKV